MSLFQDYFSYLCLFGLEGNRCPTVLFFQQLPTKIFHFFTAQHTLIPIHLPLRLLFSGLALFQFSALKKLPTLFPKVLLTELHLLPHELAGHSIISDSNFSGLFFNLALIFENAVNRFLPVYLVDPLVLADFVVVHLFIEDVLALGERLVPFDQFIFMLDGPGPLGCHPQLFLFA